MCTLTSIPGRYLGESSGAPVLRIAFSRDERRTRPAARPPAVCDVEGRRVLMPVDPQGGGTWIAVTDAGLVLAVLNVTAHVSEGAVSMAPPWPGRVSRGRIIPSLADARDVDDVERRVARLEPANYAPFHFVCAAEGVRLDARADGTRLRVRRTATIHPWMRTSSGLGDGRVIGPRRRLFETWFRDPPFAREAQDDFHRHYWEADRPASVMMSRPDARTVSITTVEVGKGAMAMRYEVVPDVGRG